MLTDTLHLKRICYIYSEKLEEFEWIWGPMISYLEGTES